MFVAEARVAGHEPQPVVQQTSYFLQKTTDKYDYNSSNVLLLRVREEKKGKAKLTAIMVTGWKQATESNFSFLTTAKEM